MKSLGQQVIAGVFASVFLIGMFGAMTSVFSSPESDLRASAEEYTSATRGDITVGVNISFEPYRDIVNNAGYHGPLAGLVKAPNGDYLMFVRNGTSHAGPGDYGILEVYRSTDDGVSFSFNLTLLAVDDRDVRNIAAGVGATGRIFVFAWVFDCDNVSSAILPELGDLDYKYSDNSGSTWSVVHTMTIAVMDDWTDDSSPYGKLEILDNGRIGFPYYGFDSRWNVNNTRARFCYSDDNGANWTSTNISAVGSFATNDAATETDIAYLGGGQLVAISRIEAVSPYHHMYTSVDNGVTWIPRGERVFASNSMRGPTLATIKDNAGGIWVVAFAVYNNYFYNLAYGPDLMADGSAAWAGVQQWAPGSVATGYGLIGAGVFDEDTGHGLLIATEYSLGSTAKISAQNVNVTITMSYEQRIDARYGPQVSPIIKLTFVFLGLLLVLPLLSFAMGAMEGEETNIAGLIGSVVLIVVGAIMLVVAYKMMAGG